MLELNRSYKCESIQIHNTQSFLCTIVPLRMCLHYVVNKKSLFSYSNNRSICLRIVDPYNSES